MQFLTKSGIVRVEKESAMFGLKDIAFTFDKLSFAAKISSSLHGINY